MTSLENSGFCYHCQHALTPLDYGRQDTCKGCGRDTRVCKNCVHYDPNHYNECRENQADRVVDKVRSNFCDYFRPRADKSGSGAPSRDDLKKAADALFKKL